jgi:1-deoxy-D-xylulose-5-phosphate reductoisomerase
MMNKGLELIEAIHLFAQPMENIEILVHPQSIIHSMVQYRDGSVIAQLGLPDMRLPILYALSAPNRVETNFPRLNFLTCGNLSFEAPNLEIFPCLKLAQHAAKTGGTLPAVMNYLNEWAVTQFLQEKISFYDISDIIEQAFGIYNVKNVTSLADIHEAEDWAKEFVITPEGSK